ncbi:MAG: hypothetical protein V4506_10025 [Bacteroidota bacterium]
MAELIIIRAGQNSGKTTTTGLVYQELLKHAEKEHVFNDVVVTRDSLEFNDIGDTIDFTAILTIKNKKIGFASAGDDAKATKKKITIFIEIKIDIIICCARSINREGSTYRMLMEDFSATNNIALEIFTEYDENKSLKNEIKKTVVDQISKKVLDIAGK